MEKKGPIRPLHLGVSVADLDASIQWYHDMLDFDLKKTVRVEHIRCDIAVMGLRGTDFELELFHHWDSKPVPEERLDPDTDVQTQGVKHLCFYVEGLEKKIEQLRAADVTIVCGPGTFEPYTFYYIQDNSGALVELQELI
ncbi:MAG: VOC family protein [Oscillospiraceae bacterium]|nr:VOC family protein [Oscillospiraceae bacterium]